MGPFKIQNIQLFSNIPVGLGLKIKLTGFAPTPHFRIVRVALADGHIFRRNVGDRHHDLFQAGFDLPQAGIVRRNLIADGADLRHFFFCILTGFFQLADLFGRCVPFILQGFHLLGQFPAFLVQRQKLIQAQLPVPVMNGFNHFFGILPYKFHI